MRTALLTVAWTAACLIAGGSPASAQTDAGQILEVELREDDAESVVLLDRGRDHEVAPGRTIEVRREGKTIGYGTVSTVFKTRAVANVGTVVTGASPLRSGDTIRFHGEGFLRPGADPVAPKTQGELPAGQVVGVRDKVILLDFGGDAGGRDGDQISIRVNDEEVGRVEVQLVDANTAVGTLTQGRAQVGAAAVTVARGKPAEDGIDFVALSFLGVVADLEHPTPHRSACHIGVPVRRIMGGSPAQGGGISPGDRVVAIDGQVVRDVAAIRERIEARAAATVRVALIRGDRLEFVNVSFR